VSDLGDQLEAFRAAFRDYSVLTHGEQEGSVWNGHYECTCYHPLFVFNQFGDLDDVHFVPAMFTVPMAGTACSSRRCALAGQGLAPLFPR
jgi:hypothetical protein